MRYYRENENIIVEELDSLNLRDTLDGGQSFRWQELPDGSFEGIAGASYLQISARGQDCFVLHSTTEEQFENLWRNYFDMDRDYNSIRTQLCTDPVLAEVVTYAPGIRVLRQEGWEALCCFILSQNNNIKRIKGIVERLCENFGAPLANGKFAFPSAERLAACTLDDLAPLRAGFRAKYILDAAQKVTDGAICLQELPIMPLEQAKAQLLQIKGVGIKVADCALLYGFGRLECFPEDVWIKRAMSQLFPQGLPVAAQQHAGIAQQYIFHYARTSGVLATEL